MEYNREKIAAYLKARRNRYTTISPAMIDREIARRQAEDIRYKTVLVIATVLALSFIGFGALAIVNTFKGNWPHCVGFGVVAYLCLSLFRRIGFVKEPAHWGEEK